MLSSVNVSMLPRKFIKVGESIKKLV